MAAAGASVRGRAAAAPAGASRSGVAPRVVLRAPRLASAAQRPATQQQHASSSRSGGALTRRAPVCVAATPNGRQGEQQQQGASGVAALIGTPIYTVLEVGELLVVLMLIDAAFSGDWSRIGVITTDTELVLQKIAIFVVTAHLGTGAAAGVLASRKGKSPVVPFLKGFAFGALGLYEEQHSP